MEEIDIGDADTPVIKHQKINNDDIEISDDDLDTLSETLTDEDIESIQHDIGIKPEVWSREMIGLHIYHAVTQHMERGNHGVGAQMKAVNQCLKDLVDMSPFEMAKISSESVKYSSMIDEWLVKNGYATRIK